ncbi:MAG: acetyl-CoA carboxylase biotin carboxyl carrier protein subunit [Roseiflexaceae bacterium]
MSIINVTIDGRAFEVELELTASGAITARVDGVPVQVSAGCLAGSEPLEWLAVDGRPHEVLVDRDLRWLRSRAGLHRLELRDRSVRSVRPAGGDGRIKAPIPGLIARVLVEAGQPIEAGQPLLVLEAMKMENEIRAPRAGIVAQLNVAPGQAVTLQQLLAEIAPETTAGQ